MKKLLFITLSSSILALAACKNETNPSHQDHSMKKDTVQSASQADTAAIKLVPVTYAHVEPQAAAAIREIIGHYLNIKNALVSDKSSEAASSGKAMAEVMKKFDKSLLTAEQKKTYDAEEDDLKEHAEHIGKNSGNIKHQREHFSMMSEDVYNLVKAFGGGQPLYHDHCPMYNENKGAMWISEIKEVKNPYLGSEMPTCGTVEEIIR